MRRRAVTAAVRVLAPQASRGRFGTDIAIRAAGSRQGCSRAAGGESALSRERRGDGHELVPRCAAIAEPGFERRRRVHRGFGQGDLESVRRGSLHRDREQRREDRRLIITQNLSQIMPTRGLQPRWKSEQVPPGRQRDSVGQGNRSAEGQEVVPVNTCAQPGDARPVTPSRASTTVAMNFPLM